MLTAHSNRRLGSTAMPNAMNRPSCASLTNGVILPLRSTRTIRRWYWLLTKNERALVRVIRRGAIVTDAVYDGRTGLRSGLLSVVAVSKKFPTLGTGGKLRVKGRLVQPLPEYTAADCPRYGRAEGDNCPGSGRAAVGSLVGGGLTGRGERR